jgi:hypothetical protein
MKPKKEGKKLWREARERRNQEKPRKRRERSPEKNKNNKKSQFLSNFIPYQSLYPLDYKTCLNRP